MEQMEQRLRAGDEEVMTELIARYGQPLLRYCHGILCDYHEAQDAVQLTFIKAYTHREKAPEDALSPWLYRIAYTTSVDLLRRRKLRQGLRLTPPAPADTYVRLRLREALLALSAGERALLFSRVEGAAYEELEKVYHVSAAVLRKRYQRAKDKLAKGLADETETEAAK